MNAFTPLNSAGERFLIDLAGDLESVEIAGIPELQRYWNDDDYRSRLDAERDQRRAQFNAAMSAHDARERARQEARWAAGEASSC